jgi:hypothetical protein
MWPRTELSGPAVGSPWLRLLAGAAVLTTYLTVFLAAFLTSASTHADGALLNGALGRWLEIEAAPELAELLAKHPKFAGETIKLVSLRDGRPVEDASRLHQAVQSELTQQLLKYPGVKLAWQEPRGVCGVPQTINYLLGIDIEHAGGQEHRLSIGMVDVAESVWVSGISLTWQGRLSAAEKVALRTEVPSRPRGTVDSPLPAAETREIAEQLKDNVRCSLPDGLAGAVFVEPAEGQALNRLRSELQRNLTLSAMAAMTPKREEAAWIMKVDAREVGNRTQEVVLTLTDPDRDVTQQVASVFVTGLAAGAPRTTTAPPDVIATAPAADVDPGEPQPYQPMLSGFDVDEHARGGICDSHRSSPDPCVEVSFELNRDAYLFVLSTSASKLTANSCATGISRETAGERRFRMRVSANDIPGTGDAGLYAIAVDDRNAARALANLIHKAPGACTGHTGHGLDEWLTKLDLLLDAYPGAYEWRALHLTAGPDGVIRI